MPKAEKFSNIIQKQKHESNTACDSKENRFGIIDVYRR